MYSSLDDVEFLSRSDSRVEVLDAIVDSPRTRHELRELTGASRVTVNRILDDLESRGWIVRDEGRSEATAQGEYVAEEFTKLLENMSVANELDGAISWLPTEQFEFDIAHLQDAEVIRTASWEEHTATIRKITDLVYRTSRIWGTAVGFSHEVVEAIREVTTGGEASFEVVIDDATLAMIRSDEGLRTRFTDILASENATMSLHTDESPLDMVMLFDDTAMVCGHVDDGPPPGTVHTDDEAVRAWAESYYELALENSRSLDCEALEPESPDSA